MPPKTGAAVEQYVYNLSNSLAKLGVNEHLVTGVEADAEFDKGVTVHESFTPPFKFDASFYGWAIGFLVGGVSTFITAFKTLQDNRLLIRLVHGHDLLSTFLLILAKKSLMIRTPIFFTIHGSTSRRSYYSGVKALVVGIGRCIELFVWKNTDLLVVLGTNARNELVRDWGVTASKIRVIEPGVDTNFFIPDPSRLEALRNRYELPPVYCLFVGRLSPMKGPQFLLQALEDLQISCLLVGDGPYMEELKALSQQLGISSRVTFSGLLPRADVKDLYGGALFFVLPTLKEGNPLVILEAMSSSLPVISTDVSGIPDIVKDGYNGFVVPPEDMKSLRDRMKILVRDEPLRKVMSSHARETALANDWHHVAKCYRELYA